MVWEMRIPRPPHRFHLTPKEAVSVQRRLADRVRITPLPRVRQVLGLDCAFAGDRVLAVGVVWDVRARRVIETRGASAPLTFPYVPGLLSFRELPVLLALMRRIVSRVDAVLCDGQGIAHPRRFGIGAHLGVITGLPTVGSAKSRLCGTHADLPLVRGASTPLIAEDGSGERIGSVLCTRDGVRPLYVSPGHLADFASAERLVLDCSVAFRLPEPTRLADRLVARFKRDGAYRGGLSRGGLSMAAK
ncbi:MAG: endonuclease V [Pseudomonadales bacterium]|jgi:deoxyribonuclease V